MKASLQEGFKEVTIATLSGVPRYYTFRIRAILQGQRVISLIDGGATHDFIDTTLVARRHIPMEEFKEFEVLVAYGYNMICTHRIRRLYVTLENYTLTNEFYVVDLADTNMVLGVQWLYSLGYFKMNYHIMRMESIDQGGQRVILIVMSSREPNIIFNKHMEVIFRHGDVTCAIECLITQKKPS